uniref:zinc finger BED domain-containing protein 5-like isoform X1 n=1 Tax=Styela clava TaxID=7725 RepID=UPI001939BF71|nr:zinc finger BED domain-containing protein 5-like isoform X1 [Styela clava]XP_039264457.1 zinc finger BED domain-containing protein 5-like isoform X1 [Styela clava]
MSKRKYSENYIEYGFIAIEHRGDILPQCVICMKTLSNAALKPSLLKRHLETNHTDKMNRDKSYFERLGENVKRQRMDYTGQFYQKNAGIVKASYEVSLLVAQHKKAHVIAESLILPAAKILVRNLIGEESAAKLDSVSLSNNTVKRRIEEMSVDITDQVIAGVRNSKFGFALQLDESTDVTNCCQLLAYVRFIQNDTVKTELMLNHELSTTSKGKDIFNSLDNFFKENELDWGNLVGCTTDGAPSMLGRKSGFQALVKAVSPRVVSVHCFIHRFALCTKVLPANLLMCLNRVIKIVNFVKTSALNTRLFKVLCEDLGSDHSCLLYHTEVRWLSRGNTTKRLFEMRDELLLFFQQKDHDFQNDLQDEDFIAKLAYLSDIFETFNHLNLSFQGKNCTVADFVSKLGAFIRKLIYGEKMWKTSAMIPHAAHTSQILSQWTQPTYLLVQGNKRN